MSLPPSWDVGEQHRLEFKSSWNTKEQYAARSYLCGQKSCQAEVKRNWLESFRLRRRHQTTWIKVQQNSEVQEDTSVPHLVESWKCVGCSTKWPYKAPSLSVMRRKWGYRGQMFTKPRQLNSRKPLPYWKPWISTATCLCKVRICCPGSVWRDQFCEYRVWVANTVSIYANWASFKCYTRLSYWPGASLHGHSLPFFKRILPEG